MTSLVRGICSELEPLGLVVANAVVAVSHLPHRSLPVGGHVALPLASDSLPVGQHLLNGRLHDGVVDASYVSLQPRGHSRSCSTRRGGSRGTSYSRLSMIIDHTAEVVFRHHEARPVVSEEALGLMSGRARGDILNAVESFSVVRDSVPLLETRVARRVVSTVLHDHVVGVDAEGVMAEVAAVPVHVADVVPDECALVVICHNEAQVLADSH